MFSLYTYYCLAYDSYKAWLHRRYYRSLLMNAVIAAYVYFVLYRRDELIESDAGEWIWIGSLLLFFLLIPFALLTLNSLGRPITLWNKRVEKYEKWRLRK